MVELGTTAIVPFSARTMNRSLTIAALFVLLVSVPVCAAYVVYPLKPLSTSRGPSRITTTARFNFFKDLLGSAFENDATLSKDDKLDGMLDEGVEEIDAERMARVQQLTSTQQQWRQKMQSAGGAETSDLEGSKIELDLYLTGIPNKDPSNDLYGSKSNISSRDRVIGLTLPSTPSVAGVSLSFEPNAVCRVVDDASGFCSTDSPGDWKLSDDGRQIRFRLPVTGYTRTIETKGSIQKVYWSQEEEKTTQTSTVYSIPEGWMYGETELTKAVGKAIQWNDDGVLKVEVSRGLLGASSRMIPCGKFSAKPLSGDDEAAKKEDANASVVEQSKRSTQ